MKQIWDTEDLASHWSLSFEEIQLLKSKPAVLVHRKFARKPDLSFPIPSHRLQFRDKFIWTTLISRFS